MYNLIGLKRVKAKDWKDVNIYKTAENQTSLSMGIRKMRNKYQWERWNAETGDLVKFRTLYAREKWAVFCVHNVQDQYAYLPLQR